MSDDATIVTEHHREIQDAKHWHATAPTVLLLACVGTCSRNGRALTEHNKSRWQVGIYKCATCGNKQPQPWRSLRGRDWSLRAR